MLFFCDCERFADPLSLSACSIAFCSARTFDLPAASLTNLEIHSGLEVPRPDPLAPEPISSERLMSDTVKFFPGCVL